ncbi:MAG: response regulator [Candidatus Goldbacteria bacterium]|nr:response regulator [Candidatus Goldiibacteriota bacterium]
MEQKKKIHLYIVDDEPGVCNLIKVLFTEFGYEVSVANSGQILLEQLNKEDLPDIILLDIMMPEMSGYDICKKIKSDERLKKIKVLLYTALPEYAIKDRAEESCADGFVTKDIEPEELSRIIINLLVKQ